MEMHQLRYFVAVAQCGTFGRAAELCHVSQPSLSQQIQKLERSVGQKLFDRLGRRVQLTDAGRLLLDRATAILETADDAKRRLRHADEGEGGQLTVGAIPTIAPYLLPPALQRFVPRFPNVELTVHEDVTDHLLRAVEAGELDLALVALPMDEERLHVEPLFSEELLLALPRAHRLARQRKITIDDVRKERFILLNEMHCLSDQVLSFCHAHDCQPRIACRSAQVSTVQTMIEMGQGVSFLPATAEHADRSKGRVYRSLGNDSPHRTVGVIRRRHRYHSPSAERFLEGLRQLAAELRESVQGVRAVE
jgi:LysR family hydrogen peroxide-inducible transcriptional activator